MANVSLQANSNGYENTGITHSDEELAAEMADCALEIETAKKETEMGVCVRCGSGEVYEGQCVCWVIDFDAEGQNAIDRAMEEAGGVRVLLDGTRLLYPVFGAGERKKKKATKKAAEDAFKHGLFRLSMMEETDPGFEGLLAMTMDVAKASRDTVMNEAFRIQAESVETEYVSHLREAQDLTPGSVLYAAAVEEMRSRLGEFADAHAATKPPEGGDEEAEVEEEEDIGEGAGKGACPVEPYENGYCWFYAIDPESRSRMWDEIDCAAFASLREINQLGREYGYSRTRLIIRRISDGKYHMEPDIGGSSGTARTFQAWMDEIYSPNGIHSRAKTGLFGMPYSNFEGKIRTASLGNWVEVQLLLTTVNACLGRDFSKVTERKAAADDYRKMDRTCPFSHTMQFPHYDQYVWMDGGDWPNKEMQLYSALAYQEASVEDNRGGGGGADRQRPNQPVSNSFGYNDAATAYYNALRNMKNQVVTMSGVFDRSGLELHFRSFWTADKVVDLIPLVKGVLQPSVLLVDEHAPGQWNWAGLNRYVELDQANNLTTLPASGMVVLWSSHRVAGHRARVVMQRDQHGGSNAISFEVVATAT